MKMFRYILLSVLLFSGLFGADSFYQQTKFNTSWKDQANIKLVDNNDSEKTFSLSTSIEGVDTSSGNLQVANRDSAGNEAINGLFGEAISEKRHSDVSVQFQYNYFDEQFDVKPEEVTGDGITSSANSLATVSSAATGTALRSSRDVIRYNPGHTGYSYFTASFSGTGVGQAGCFDDENGFILEVSNGVASFGYLKSGNKKGSNGAAGFDASSGWNGNFDISGLDLTKINIFMIRFGYLGVANPTLWVKLDRWYVLHTVKTEGVLTVTHVDSPVFPISIYAENNMTVSSGSWTGGTIGERNGVGSRGFTFPNTMISGTGTTTQGEMLVAQNTTGTIVIFRAKTTFHSKVNHVKARLTGYSFHIDVPAGNVLGIVQFQIVGIQTLSGVATYADINTISSVMEYDHTDGTGASVDPTAGTPLVTNTLEYVGANKGGNASDAVIDAESIGAVAYAGDTFAIVAKNIGNSDVVVRITVNWEELF